ncbi:MAG: ABC transporter permease [Promethearchaeota archaeon]
MVRDIISLFIDFVQNNWKAILISTIGLTLALTSVAQTTIVLESYRKSLFEEFLAPSYFPYQRSDFETNLYTHFDRANTESIQSTIQYAIDNTGELGQKAAANLEFSDFLEREIWHWSFRANLDLNVSGAPEGHDYSVYIDAVDNEVLQACQSFLIAGRLPQAPNEVILFTYEQWGFNPDMMLGVGLPLRNIAYPGNEPHSAMVIITGIVEFSKDRYNTPVNTDGVNFWNYFEWFLGNNLLLTTQPNLIDLATELYDNARFDFTIHGLINVKLSELDAYNLAGEIARLEQFQQQLDLEGSALGYISIQTKAPIIWKIELFEEQFAGTVNLTWLFSLPTLVATLFLAMFALNLLSRRKRRQIAIMKRRGATSRRIFGVLFGESLIITVCSVGLGTIIGWPFAQFILQTQDFLDFTGKPIPLILPPMLIQMVFGFGLIFGSLLHLRSMLWLSKSQISENLTPQSKVKPFWKKYYLDVILFSLGMLGILSLLLMMGIEPDLSMNALLVLFSSTILITVGGAMLVARFLPIFLRVFARWTWQREGGILAFGLRNLLHRSSHASRVTLLVSIVLAFSLAFITIPYNYDLNTKDTYIYHNLGADMLVTPSTSDFDLSFLTYLQTNLTGIASVSPIAQASAITSSGQSMAIFGLDVNTYVQTAFFREDFLNPDALSSLLRLDASTTLKALTRGDLFPDTPNLDTLISKIQSNTTLLVQEDNLKARNLCVGDQLSLLLEGPYNETISRNNTVQYDYDIVGAFKAWPLFIHSPVSEYDHDLNVVANLSMVLDYVKAGIFTQLSVHYLVRVQPDVSMLSIKDQIVNETGVSVACIADFLDVYLEHPQRSVLLTIINGTVLILIAVILFTILMFGVYQLMERGKEIGIERVLGMSFRQTSLLFVIEAFFLLLCGIVVGLILGSFTGQMFLMTTLMTQTYLFPVVIMQYPWDLFVVIAGLILLVGLLSSLIPAFLATRLKIGDILRGE